MQFVNCPHCYAKVSVELDECPNCGEPIYNFDYKEDHTGYEEHYSDYLSTNKGTRPLYKYLSAFSVILMAIGLYLLFIVHREITGPPEDYYLVYGGMILFAVTRILIWLDNRQTI